MSTNQYTPSQKSEVGTSVLQVLGGLLFLIGVLLMLGNLSGSFVTFPFAGFITMTIGGALCEGGKQ